MNMTQYISSSGYVKTMTLNISSIEYENFNNIQTIRSIFVFYPIAYLNQHKL